METAFETWRRGMKTALVTIVIGDAYQRIYEQYIHARFERYATRHGYDVKVIDQPILDLPGKKFTWQKLCMPHVPWFGDYDRIAVLDSDILIARDAPALPDVPDGKVGLVADKPTAQMPVHYNSGVLVYRPCAAVTDAFAEARKDPEPFWDQWALTRVLRDRSMDHLIDPRFNRLVYVRCWSFPGTVLRKQWFYHALCGKSKLDLVDRLLRWQGR
jgi:hypothetical protein